MNKEEVKEVLEYCVNSDSGSSCMECKFFDFADCRYELIKCAIKLIDKQKAEIERLKAEIERLERVINDQNELCWGCKKSVKETAKEIVDRLIEIFSTAKGVCSGCALQHDKAKNPTARAFQLGKYRGFKVAEYEVKELAKQYGVEVEE